MWPWPWSDWKWWSKILMLETAIALAFAHVLADFVFQTRRITENKAGWGLPVHVIVVAATAILVLGQVSVLVLLIVLAHLAIDAAKTFLLPDRLWSYLLDQAAHLVSILVLAALFPDGWLLSVWQAVTPDWLPTVLALGTGLVFVTRAGHFAVAALLRELLPEQEQRPSTAVIGLFERAIIRCAHLSLPAPLRVSLGVWRSPWAPKQAVFSITPAAAAQIAKLMARDGSQGLRIGVKKGGCAGMEYTMDYVTEVDPNDEVVEQDGARVMIAPMAQMFLFGTEIDYEVSLLESGFSVPQPQRGRRLRLRRVDQVQGCPHRCHLDPAGRDPHARLHARGHRRDRQGDAARKRAATGADILLGNTYHLMLRPARSGWRGWAGCTGS
jgi:iron-sulfur cluster assembly protein